MCKSCQLQGFPLKIYIVYEWLAGVHISMHKLNTDLNNFYCCTVQYGIYMLFIHQQMHFLLNLEKFKLTLEYT
jgi:hypothetical protein